jgi:hypothetical protein
MTADNKTPFRVVAGTDGPAEGPESNAAKIAAARVRCRNFDGKPRKVRSDAGIPKKPAKAKAIEPAAGSKIIRDCVVYAQSRGAYQAGFKADPTGDFDYAGCSSELGETFFQEADTALRRLIGASGGQAPTRDELFAKAVVLGIMFDGNSGGDGGEGIKEAYVRFFAEEVRDYLRAAKEA